MINRSVTVQSIVRDVQSIVRDVQSIVRDVQSIVRDVQLLLWVNIYECGLREEEKKMFLIKP